MASITENKKITLSNNSQLVNVGHQEQIAKFNVNPCFEGQQNINF